MIPKGINLMTPIISYLKNGILPEDHDEAWRLKVWVACFVLIVDVLYKRGFSRPYLRCLVLNEANYVIRKVYEVVCGNHLGVQSLVHKLIRAGYYWPTMQKDAQSYVKACDKCQRFSNVVRQHQNHSPWWTPHGLFLMAMRQLKFLIIGIEYFTK